MPNWVLPMLAAIVLLAFLYFAFLHKPLKKHGDTDSSHHSDMPGDHS